MNDRCCDLYKFIYSCYPVYIHYYDLITSIVLSETNYCVGVCVYMCVCLYVCAFICFHELLCVCVCMCV